MKTNSNNPEKNEKSPTKKGFLDFLIKHNTVISLVLVIFIILLWALIKMNNMQNNAVVEKQQLTEVYENQLESLSISSMELTAQVFTWAIRGEMLRQNMDQVNQFFTSFIQKPGITKIQLVDSGTAEIILSTDNKDEGAIIENTLILQAERTYHIAKENSVLIISPVMGLNTRIGILILELNTN